MEPSLSQTLVLIPARMKASRLPDKPLADIAGTPMIVHVLRRATEAAIGRVVVACAEPVIAEVVRAAGGEAVLTDPDLPSGTDRIRQALSEIDPERRAERIVNLQGDLPTLDPRVLAQVLEPLDRLGVPMATLACATDDPREKVDPNVVKAVVSLDPDEPRIGRALYFTRATCPSGDGPILHHIGIYAFERTALERFADLPPSPLEQRERLEQLRALENGMAIGVRLVDTVPFGVDTPYDLDRARQILSLARPRTEDR
ncbi:3-deoxy-manno-octulosonate cytidylyltransferase [Geminicoccus flavidas]|uniref:3-deoxy-manno-octulosonate cytidylyltransferase n=1 Tax=Geminicoccus flavidas TaxID=2506407 RepID=UPI001356C3E3|nr:3-deoxy-manno-octulosonate cytidylyltransferase [Geminicoccus flavidas]